MTRSRRPLTWAALAAVVLLLAALGPAQAKLNVQSTTWFPIGPAPVTGFFPGGDSGRATVVAVNPFTNFDVWLGTAGGGVWHTTDADPDPSSTWHWFPTTDREESLAIGALALADCSGLGCTRIYAGTGENGIRRDTYYGKGLLVGTYTGGCAGCSPADVTWVRRVYGMGPDGVTPWNFTYGSIDNIVLDRTTGLTTPEDQVIYVTLSSGVTASASETTVTAPEPLKGWGPKAGYGIYKSNDNGLTWARQVVPDPGFSDDRPTDLEIDPTPTATDPLAHLTLYAGFLGRGIFKTSDGGVSWCPLNPGIPRPNNCSPTDGAGLPDPGTTPFDHVELAMLQDPAQHKHLYASFGMCPFRLTQECAPSIYETTDGGKIWHLKSKGSDKEVKDANGHVTCPAVYSRYTHGLTIWPGDPGTVFLSGVRLCRNAFSGSFGAWGKVDTSVDPPRILDPDHPNDPDLNIFSNHFDHHAVVFDGTGAHAWDVNDGGIFSSTDGGSSWRSRNDTLQTTEFQSIGTSSLTQRILGGTQDNSAMLWIGNKQWVHTSCAGDAGFSILDADDSTRMYTTTNLSTIAAAPIRSFTSGDSWDPFPCGAQVSGDPSSIYYPPLVQSPLPTPGSNPPQHALYYGTNRVWRSDNDAVTWTDVSPVLCDPNVPEPEIGAGVDVITAIALPPGDPNRIYVGCYSGKVFVSAASGPCNQTSCWSEVGPGLPAAPITWLAVDPVNENLVWATLSGYFPGSHVFYYNEILFKWLASGSISELNAVPADTIAVEPRGPSDPEVLWIGTDKGVYKSPNAGGKWTRFGSGLPNVPVYQISLDEPNDRIVAGTHGRGAFMLTGPSLNSYDGCASLLDSRSLVVYGAGFPHSVSCSMRILREHGSMCAQDVKDASGRFMFTDDQGGLVTSDGVNRTPVVFACLNGTCVNNVSVSACDLPTDHISAVAVTCGNQFAVASLPGCPPLINPPSTWFDLTGLPDQLLAPAPEVCADPGADPGPAACPDLGAVVGPALAGGSFDFVPALQSGDGTSRVLCSVNVPYLSTDTPSVVMQNARDAVNASSACQASGVTAVLTHAALIEAGEDPGDQVGILSLVAPGVTGGQLVASIHAGAGQATGLCFDLGGLGLALRDQLRVMRLRLITPPAGAQGGTIALKQVSSLGDCALSVPTSSGETSSQIAGALAAAFEAPDLPPLSPRCPPGHNPRDMKQEGDALVMGLASGFTVCLNDPGVGLSVTPADVCLTDADCDDKNPCTHDTCRAANGQCQHTPEPDGLPCDDANACTIGNACMGGTCGTPLSCGDGNPCSTDTCDPATGACTHAPVVCDDANPCTSDFCNPDTGQCLFSPTAGAACDDGDLCTIRDACVTDSATSKTTCRGTPACDDGNPCTDDVCSPATGQCANPPVQCDDGNPCTVDSCDTTGACVAFVTPGAVCDDGNLCTIGDTCVGGITGGDPVCLGQAVACDDGNACTIDACDPATGGCTHSPVPLGGVSGLQFTSNTTLTWSATPGAFFWNTYRGTIPSNMLGSRLPPIPTYDQTCFERDDSHGDGATLATDTANPPLGTAFYYLVAQVTGCAEGPVGTDSNGTTIPNRSPCLVP